jgi:hypothetical protein
MYIGHICLAELMSGTGEALVSLIEAIDRQGVRQHVLVRNKSLARRAAISESVVIGPIVKVPVMAYCLMPNVQVVHIHCDRSAPAGLLLTLTRSIPFVFTCRVESESTKNPIKQSVLNRAAGLIFPDKKIAASYSMENYRVPIDIVADARYGNAKSAQTNNRIAADHLKIYRRVVDSSRIPALLL